MNVTTGSLSLAVHGGDFDGDGDVDLAVARSTARIVTVLWNDGGGGFPDRSEYGVHDAPLMLLGADLDEEGDEDLVSANYYLGTYALQFAAVTILWNASDRTTPVAELTGEASSDGVVLSWSSTPDVAEALVVERAPAGDGLWSQLAILEATCDASTYTDSPAPPGREAWYRVTFVASNGERTILGPVRVTLNPAAGATIVLDPVPPAMRSGPVQIAYSIGLENVRSRLAIYDVRGARLWATPWGVHGPGSYVERWDDARAASGIYFVRLETSVGQRTERLVLARP